MSMYEESERVSTAQAAKELGCAEQWLRERMRCGDWADLGDIIKPGKGRKKYSFRIYRPRLDEHIGRNRAKQNGGDGSA